jgi:hypothetical protein
VYGDERLRARDVDQVWHDELEVIEIARNPEGFELTLILKTMFGFAWIVLMSESNPSFSCTRWNVPR